MNIEKKSSSFHYLLLLVIYNQIETHMSIKVLFFASAREAAGVSEIDVPLPSDTNDLRKLLAEMYPGLKSLVLDEDSITLALNEEYVEAGSAPSLKAGDTVALIPPISGG